MTFRRARWTAGISILVGLLLVFALAPSTLAETAGSTSGVVGHYSLNDSRSAPGVTCNYKTDDYSKSGWLGHLKQFVVEPPNVRAAAGTQKVSWGFDVQRRRGSGFWVTTYVSPLQKATTNTSTNATFTSKSVGVAIPADALTHTYTYQVTIVMLWYAPNGTDVTGSALQKDRNYTHNYGPLGIWSQGPALCKAEVAIAD